MKNVIMNDLLKEAFEELDQIVQEEYGVKYSIKLYEASDEDDEKFATPFKRAGSFPARALRYRKAKNVMNKYISKINRKSNKIISRFISEIDKTLPKITKRGDNLKAELAQAKKSGDKVAAKSIVNQQSKFLEDVKKDNEARLGQLQNGFDNLINTYTEAIHRRIDEPGYVLRVELSDKGKAELKALWDEKIAKLRQEFYGKTLEAINNKNISELENLTAHLEVEVEEARIESDRRRRRQRDKKPEGTDSGAPIPATPATDGEPAVEPTPEELDEFERIKKYLDDNLPDGLLDVDESYLFSEAGKSKVYKVYIEIDEDTKKITAVFYGEDSDYDEDDPLDEYEIESESAAKNLVDGVDLGEDLGEDNRIEMRINKFNDTLFNSLETMFDLRSKFVKDAFDLGFYERYKRRNDLKKLSQFMVGEILDNPKSYVKQYKMLDNEQVSDRSLVNLFLKKMAHKYEAQDESFISLSHYKKLNS